MALDCVLALEELNWTPLKKEKAVKFLVETDIAKVNCMKWTGGGDIKDLISSKVHLKTSVIGVTLSFIA